MTARRGTVLHALCLFALVTAAPCAGRETAVPVETLFDYDRDLPMNLREEKVEETGDYTKYHVSFRSRHERVAQAILALPARGSPPHPVLMFQHGINDNKDNMFEKYGVELIRGGYAVFIMDGELHGERATDVSRELVRYPVTFRDVFVQTVVDLRRAVDYLKGRGDLDAGRLGYIGYSLGSFEGTVFASLDKRVKAVALVVCGSFENTFAPLKMMPGYRETALIMDGRGYIGRISPRPLLMVNGEDDVLIPPESAKALFEAAGEPKKLVMLPAGHTIPAGLLVPALLEWMGNNLGG
ncbi:MAG: alpha/beta hydrolase [bacterium]